MADSTITPVGGGGSIFAPPPVSPQPISKLQRAVSAGVDSFTTTASSYISSPTDTLTLSELSKSLSAAYTSASNTYTNTTTSTKKKR